MMDVFKQTIRSEGLDLRMVLEGTTIKSVVSVIDAARIEDDTPPDGA
jgi:hypothetical protein